VQLRERKNQYNLARSGTVNRAKVLREQMSELDAWDSFYVIIGSAAGALIGVTLVAEKLSLRATEAGAAFATPTIVHFYSLSFDIETQENRAEAFS
jgi:hypothetical protein